MLHGTQGQVSFWSGWTQKRNGWGKKRRLPLEEMRTVASFSTVSSLPSLSVTYRSSTKGVWVYKYTNAQCESRWVLIPYEYIRGIIQKPLFPKLHSPEKLPPMTKINHFLSMESPLRVLMTGTGLCNKSKFAAPPLHWRGMWCAEGGPGLCCLQSLDPSFEAASVFQQLTTFRWDCGVLWAE